MTIQEFHRDIEQTVQGMGFYLYDNRETEEIDIQINKQIMMFIENCIDPDKSQKKGNKTLFSDNYIKLDDIRTLVKRGGEGVDIQLSYTNMNLPDDYLHSINLKATITYTCIENKKEVTKTIERPPRIVSQEYYEQLVNNEFHKTDRESPLGYFDGSTIYVTTDGTFKITGLLLTYIKQPAIVKFGKDGSGNYSASDSVDCDLPIHVHNKICDETARRIQKILEVPQQKIVNLEQETI
jgi:hypothetical protein